MVKKNLTVLSKRNTEIPATVVIGSESSKAPLMVFVHGFKAERTEGGRFVTVAEALAENGVNSIMMDFAGCGESTEDFFNYSLTSIMDDIDSCVAYMKENYCVDESRMGMVGYSMGGRTAAIYTVKHPEFRLMVSWAGAIFEAFDNEDDFLGGNVEEMLEACDSEGYYVLHNLFDDTYIKISKQFMGDMKQLDPVACARSYEGCALIVQGDRDDTVLPRVSISAYLAYEKAAKREHIMVHGANHGFGLWDDHMEQSKILTDSTYRFISENL